MSLKDGDIANVSRLDCDVHIGTHVDAPRHFLKSGRTVEELSLDTLIGPAVVAYFPDIGVISAHDLASLALALDTRRLLLRTRNSELWAAGVTEFREDFVALTANAARWVVNHSIRLIGVDYLSVQQYGGSPLTHRTLVKAGVIILEGLNLANVQPGTYELICLPIPLVGAEGAPARAVLREMSVTSLQQPTPGGNL